MGAWKIVPVENGSQLLCGCQATFFHPWGRGEELRLSDELQPVLVFTGSWEQGKSGIGALVWDSVTSVNKVSWGKASGASRSLDEVGRQPTDL